MFLFIVLAKIKFIVYFQQYFLFLTPTFSTLQITSKNFNQPNIAHFPVNHEREEIKRISFNEQASFSLGTVNRAQQAYFLEMAKFADSHQELGLGLPKEDNNYNLTIKSKDGLAFTYALPKKNYATYKEWSGLFWLDAQEPLYSYVSGIAYSKNNNSFQSILCVSTIVGKHKLKEPKIIKGRFICSQGTEEIP